MHYLADNIDHWSDPAYCIIKPGYRPSEPKPNFNLVEVKNNYSFSPFGDMKFPRKGANMNFTTHR